MKNIEDLLLKGEFSVSPTKKVRFAKANLASKTELIFADYQSHYGEYLTYDEAINMQKDGWRMLTKEEWKYLLSNRNQDLIYAHGRYNDNNTFIIFPDDMDGERVILPAAGYCGASSLYGDGSNGGYWSSSLGTDFPSSAWTLAFNFNNQHMNDGLRMYDFIRDNGFSVRLVRDVE